MPLVEPDHVIDALAYGRKYGLEPPANLEAAWGCRFIMRNGQLDLVPDRQDLTYVSEEARDRMIDRLGNTRDLVEMLEQTIRHHHLRGDEERLVQFIDSDYPGVEFAMSPNGSYGYLYVTTWATDDKEES